MGELPKCQTLQMINKIIYVLKLRRRAQLYSVFFEVCPNDTILKAKDFKNASLLKIEMIVGDRPTLPS